MIVVQNLADSKLEILAGPKFMDLVTVSKESALTEAGNSALTSSVVHGLAGIFASARAYSTILGILCLHS